MGTCLRILSIVLLAASAAQAANLVENGSFERRDATDQKLPASWTEHASTGDLPLEFSGEHYEGAAGGVIPGDAKPHSWRQTVKNPSIRTFTLSAMVKADDAAMAHDGYALLYGHILYKGRPYAEATHFFAKIPAGTYDWKKIAVSAAANQDTPIEAVLVTVTGNLSGGRMVVDQVSLDPDQATTPDALLNNKVVDLLSRVDRVGANTEGLTECRAHLSTAAALLRSDPNNLPDATAEWVRAANSLTHADWKSIFPQAMSDKPVEAHMIYHGQGKTKEACDQNLDIIEKAGANAVYLSLGSWMSVTYKSDLLPTAPDFAAEDSLKYFIEQAHRRNIKVLGYVAAFYGTHEPPTDSDSLSTKHPDWFAKGPDPNMPLFPDPANPQVADFIVKVYAELASRYELDGIGLDYIRYPTETALNYDAHNREEIRNRYGIEIDPARDIAKQADAWAQIVDYRAEMTRGVVERVRAAVKSARPGIGLIGCLISDPDEARNYGQNWAKSSALLDYATPMNYAETSADEKLLSRQRDIFAGNKTLFIAAVGGMPEVHHAWTLSTWADRIATQRRIGCDGIIVYRFGDLDPAVVAFLGKGAFYNRATFPGVPTK